MAFRRLILRTLELCQNEDRLPGDVLGYPQVFFLFATSEVDPLQVFVRGMKMAIAKRERCRGLPTDGGSGRLLTLKRHSKAHSMRRECRTTPWRLMSTRTSVQETLRSMWMACSLKGVSLSTELARSYYSHSLSRCSIEQRPSADKM